MKRKTNLIIIIAIVILTTASCNRPKCENENPVFDDFDIRSEEYKTALVNQIEKYGQNNLNYWVDGYIEENGNEYIIVNIQNESLCAKGMIQVNNWNGIEEIQRTEGKGYIGAKLEGLKFSVKKDSASTEFIYKSLIRIVD